MLHIEVYPESKIEHRSGMGCNGRKCSSHFSYFSHVSFKRTCSYCTIYPTVTSQVLCPPVSGILTIYLLSIAVHWHHFSLTVLESFAIPLVVHFERYPASQTCCHFYSHLSRIKRPYSARLPSGLRDSEAACSSD